jgi:hypothetical protein
VCALKPEEYFIAEALTDDAEMLAAVHELSASVF